MKDLILVINPGSTSTKIADQYEFRANIIKDTLSTNDIFEDNFCAIVGRGGLLKPIDGGVWEVNEKMLKDLQNPAMGEHASNLGAMIAYNIAKKNDIPAFIVDPVVVDEMDEYARFSGHPDFKRLSIFHALNQKASARRAAKELGKDYEKVNLIVAHMGGGVSVGAHKQGRVIDVNNALNGDGPFSPERSGGLPAGQLVKLCFSGKYTQAEIGKMIKGKGGLTAYLGTSDAREVGKKAAEGDKQHADVYNAMAYQIAKEIGSLAPVLEGNIDAIVLTGGLAYNHTFTDLISKRVSFISKVLVYPGEDEMEALNDGALRVLSNSEKAKVYS